MAEIEYFVDPLEKETHPKFENVANLEVTLFSGCDQLDGKGPIRKTLGAAVREVWIGLEHVCLITLPL